MRTRVALVISFAMVMLATSSGPDDRQVTDPASVTSPSNAAARPIPIDELFFTRSVGGPSWSPDGKEIVFTTNLTGRNNLWKVQASGGWPIQLSQSDDRQGGAVWSPDGKWILYEQDRGGQEYFDIFAIPSAGGEAVNLTNTDDISETGAHFSPDGAAVAISYKPKTSSTPDIALMDWSSRKVRTLTQEQSKDHVWQYVAWSPDGRSIYANRTNAGATDGDVYRVDVANGNLENLTLHKGQVLHSGSSISADGRTLLVTSNEKAGFNNIALLDIASKTIKWVTDTKWDAISGHFGPQGGKYTFFVNEDGRTEAYLADRDGGQPEKISFPAGLTFFSGNPCTLQSSYGVS